MTVSLHHNCPNDLNGRNSRRWPHTAVSYNYFPHNKPCRHIMGHDIPPTPEDALDVSVFQSGQCIASNINTQSNEAQHQLATRHHYNARYK